MGEYRQGRRCCGTCVFWNGDREVNASRSVIRTAYSEAGECGHAMSGFRGQTKKSTDNCSRWEVWDVFV